MIMMGEIITKTVTSIIKVTQLEQKYLYKGFILAITMCINEFKDHCNDYVFISICTK